MSSSEHWGVVAVVLHLALPSPHSRAMFSVDPVLFQETFTLKEYLLIRGCDVVMRR